MAIRGLFEDDFNLGGQTQQATQQALNPLAATPTPVPKVNGTLSQTLGPALGGLQAGQGFTATDPTEATVGILGATATGALAGSVGGPVGALVGAGTGLLSSALNSWLSVRSENKRKRETQKLIKEVEAKQAKEKAQNRKDSLLQLRFNRKDTERAQAINAFQTKRALLTDAINNNQSLKDRFIQTGVR